MASYIKTLGQAIVTRLQAATWVALSVADADISFAWAGGIDLEDIGDPKIVVCPVERDRTNTTRATYEDKLVIDVNLLWCPEELTDENQDKIVELAGEVMAWLDRQTFGECRFQSQGNDPLLEIVKVKQQHLLRSTVNLTYVRDFIRS